MMDPLTRVANRRAFFHLARTEIDRSRRYRNPFSVMVIDIDEFKQINDQGRRRIDVSRQAKWQKQYQAGSAESLKRETGVDEDFQKLQMPVPPG
jgi:predicted signal transduction protein with EAL and GGDEF domain